MKYRVKYYDRVLSHKGQGVQVRLFATYDEASAFAQANVLYAKPCRVERHGNWVRCQCGDGSCMLCDDEGMVFSG